MSWVLILFLRLDGRTEVRPVAVMFDKRICVLAGEALADLTEDAIPGAAVSFRCLQGQILGA